MSTDEIARLHERLGELAHMVEMHDERMRMEAAKSAETFGRLNSSMERVADSMDRFVNTFSQRPAGLDHNRVIIALVLAVILSSLGQEGLKLAAAAMGLKLG